METSNTQSAEDDYDYLLIGSQSYPSQSLTFHSLKLSESLLELEKIMRTKPHDIDSKTTTAGACIDYAFSIAKHQGISPVYERDLTNNGITIAPAELIDRIMDAGKQIITILAWAQTEARNRVRELNRLRHEINHLTSNLTKLCQFSNVHELITIRIQTRHLGGTHLRQRELQIEKRPFLKYLLESKTIFPFTFYITTHRMYKDLAELLESCGQTLQTQHPYTLDDLVTMLYKAIVHLRTEKMYSESRIKQYIADVTLVQMSDFDIDNINSLQYPIMTVAYCNTYIDSWNRKYSHIYQLSSTQAATASPLGSSVSYSPTPPTYSISHEDSLDRYEQRSLTAKTTSSESTQFNNPWAHAASNITAMMRSTAPPPIIPFTPITNQNSINVATVLPTELPTRNRNTLKGNSVRRKLEFSTPGNGASNFGKWILPLATAQQHHNSNKENEERTANNSTKESLVEALSNNRVGAEAELNSEASTEYFQSDDSP